MENMPKAYSPYTTTIGKKEQLNLLAVICIVIIIAQLGGRYLNLSPRLIVKIEKSNIFLSRKHNYNTTLI